MFKFRTLFTIFLGCFLAQEVFAQIHWPLVPFNEAHRLFTTYGDWNGFTVYQTPTIGYLGYHSGVDMPAPFGTPVYAVEACSVSSWFPDTFPCGGDSGWICLSKTMADYTAWHYGHIDSVPKVLWQESTAVADSQKIGVVAQFHDFQVGDHLHFMRSKAWYDTVNAYANPLTYLSPSPTQIPAIDMRGSPPPHHPYKIYYVKDKLENITNSYEMTYLRDSVDIIVKAYTTVQGDPGCGVYAIGYGVQPKTAGGNIPFRKMFEMRDTIKVSDSLKYYITYADTGADTLSRHFNNWYIVTNCGSSTPQPGYGISNIQENCWPTKINIAGTANADSIEDANFPDGYYITTIKVWSHSGDSAVAVDTVLVDNFNPRVKKTYPESLFAFVPTKLHKIWCIFSEQMDTSTLNTSNIKIQSLKSDSFNYPITNITYVKDSFKLYLAVDSFRFKDTVQVRLLDGVKDLAGKSIQDSKQTVAYSWTFVVGVIQLTDNDFNDLYPDVYHGKITWAQAPLGTDIGEIVLYDFYNNTLDTISPGGGNHSLPFIYQNKVAWLGAVDQERNYVYYYDGNIAHQIAPATRGHTSIEIDGQGIVWRSYKYLSSDYDSIWAEYYNFDSNYVYSLDSFIDYWGRYRGWADIDEGELVWDHSCYPTQDNEIYYYHNGVIQNFTNDPDSSDRLADIDGGQIVWIKEWAHGGYGRLWYYDGASKRRLGFTQGSVYYAHLHNGCIAWVDEPQTYRERLGLFDGRDTLELMRRETGYSNPAFSGVTLHNKQVGWFRLVYEENQWPFYGYYNVSLYDGEMILHLTTDTLDTGGSCRIEVHDGFVVYDAWDGNDYEIYLYLSDTLFTPPAVVKNLQGEVIGGKSPGKKVKLTWKANTEPDLAGYKIYRSDISYQYGTTPYATVLAPETTFIDTIPLEGMNYYVATAYDNLNNESGFSNQVSVMFDTIPPAVPTNLEASYDSISQKVSLIWRASQDGDLKLYRIYRSEISGNYTTPLDSVLKTDTTFIDSTIYLGKTYYYVVSAVDTNRNESGFSNEDTVIVPFFIASDFAKSTAYNNGHKILSSPTGNKIYFLYANEGWTVPSGIFYCYSQDSGRTFERTEQVDSSGLYPALGIDPWGNPCASWPLSEGIAYTYWTASWAPPESIVLPVENVSPPSMAIDQTDTVHLVFTQYYYLPSDTGDLIYLKFHRQHFSDAICETLLTQNFCRMPSLVLDGAKNLHILWQGEKSICYWQKDSTGWFGIDTIYTTTTNEKLYPMIDLYGSKINTVWQDRDSLGNLDIYSRQKNDTVWDGIKKVASIPGESRFPTLSGGHYCLWQDSSSGNWEVYKSEYIDTLGAWTSPQNISNTLTGSVYPHSTYALVNSTSAKLYCLWTEGDTIPYSITFKKLDVSPVAKVFADLGQPVQSSYCLQRDGYWIFGDKPYETTDWGYDTLKYKFTGLNPEKEYRIDLAYYFKNQAVEGNSGQFKQQGQLGNIRRNDTYSLCHPELDSGSNENEGIGRIIQVLVVDGVSLDTAFITPNKLVRKSVWLKKESYADGEIICKIQKIKGKRVVCSEIALFEFSEEEKIIKASGPQGGEAQITMPFYFESIYPNPAKGILRIRFNSPDERNVSIKLYDVCGRLVHKQDIRKSKLGINEVLIRVEGLSNGIYFVRLEVEEFNKAEKVILLR